jgi:hypothetical protein
MNKKRLFVLLLVGTITFLAVLCLKLDRKIHSVVLNEKGDTFTVSVYNLPDPLWLPSIYEQGVLDKEMKVYPWLKPLLFTRLGIDEYIPKEEWGEYATFVWTDKQCAFMMERCKKLKSVVLGHEKGFWSGVRLEVKEVVLCESKNSRGLEVFIRGFSADGKALGGGEYHKLVDFGGRWKRTPDKDEGRYATQLMNCYEKAMKLVAEGKLKTNPIRKLR